MDAVSLMDVIRDVISGADDNALMRVVEVWWPTFSCAAGFAWFFVWFSRRYLASALLRWFVASFVIVAMLVPVPKVSLAGWLVALTGPLSCFSAVLIFASIHLGPRELLPKSSWLMVLLLCCARTLDNFGLIPVSLAGLAYPSQATLMSLAIANAILVMLTFSIALRRPVLGFCALLPALLWRFQIDPFQDLWNAYTDLPLMIVSLVASFTRVPTNGAKA